VRAGGGLVAVGPAVAPAPAGWRRLLGMTAAAPPLPAGSAVAVDDASEPATRLVPPAFVTAGPLAPAAAPVRGQVLAAAPGAAPVAWCRREGKGRVLADALGPDEWPALPQQALVAGGLAWAMGLAVGERCR
jgi:hypothetical protein